MATKVKKMSISLPLETLAMIDWIKEHEMFFGTLSFSGCIRMIVEDYYFMCLENENKNIARARDYVRARVQEQEKNLFSHRNIESD